jgi:hypothetical protein
MMKDSTDLHIQGLEMKGGLAANIDYPQKFVRCPKSQYPGKAPAHAGEEMPKNSAALKITLGG